MDNKQIDAKLLLLNFNASNTTEATINVPFSVTDILFHPPVSSFTVATTSAYIVTCTIVNGGCQTMSGYNAITYSTDFRHRFAQPTAIRGTFTFSLFDIRNGNPAAFTGGVAFPIEFIGYN